MMTHRSTRLQASLAFSCLLLAAGTLSAQDGGDMPTKDAGATAEIPDIRFVRAWPEVKVRRPVQLVSRPDRDDVLYVVEQFGRVRTVDGSDRSSADSELVMDITDRVNARSNEEGLLSIAFHPEFEKNNEVYVYYTAAKGGGKPRRAVLSRFGMDDDRMVFDPDSEEIILEIEEPYWNHNGGTVLIGPDGMLYLAVGDGGAANDPHNYGQDLGSLLAKVLRIDVSKQDGDAAYAIPADNPFVDTEGARGEIWAYGLRNIWRMSFDPVTGKLWAGDVGQNKWEEIDVVERGGNYGWNIREGAHPFRRKRAGDATDLIDPVAEYRHREGLSVTGGNVYRGSEHPSLEGVYLFADYSFGTVWGMREDGDGYTSPRVVLKKPGSLISSFGEDNKGELYVTTFENGEQGPGALWAIEAR
jgi:glucose/arabinose dehydrogenase